MYAASRFDKSRPLESPLQLAVAALVSGFRVVASTSTAWGLPGRPVEFGWRLPALGAPMLDFRRL